MSWSRGLSTHFPTQLAALMACLHASLNGLKADEGLSRWCRVPTQVSEGSAFGRPLQIAIPCSCSVSDPVQQCAALRWSIAGWR